MSQPGQQDQGGASGVPILDRHCDQPQPTSNEPPWQPLTGASNYGDSSWLLYTMYSKIAKEEDNTMVERYQKQADGALIFSGLFSATIAALLTVSIPDLKPNSQDTSAFYLKNIYQVLGNLNVSHPSIPSALAKPPAFSPPRYAVWVNSLWFLSLALSLWGAGKATVRLNWTLQYIGITQLLRVSPLARARIRAIFTKAYPYTIWESGDDPISFHLSLFLFIAGGLIYLFNLNHATFYAVVWFIGAFVISFIYESVETFLKPHYLFHTPLSSLGLWLYLGISYVALQVCSHIRPLHGFRETTKSHYRDVNNRYNCGFLMGKLRAVRDFASELSSEIDDEILLRVLFTLDDDHTIETFFDAIPGFCSSEFTVLPLSSRFQTKLQEIMDGFLDRTFSSTSVSESARTRRLITCLNATYAVSGSLAVSQILGQLFNGNWDEALQSVEIGHALRHWVHYKGHDLHIQRLVACIIARAQRRDDCWITLVQDAFGVPDSLLRDYLAHGDSVLLSILIQIAHQPDRFYSWTPEILSSLSKFDIRNTLPELQHNFCALWNEIVQEARNQGSSSTPAHILREIQHLYFVLHQGINHAPTVLPVPTQSLFDANTIQLLALFSYQLCDIASHRPDSTARVSITDSRAPLHTQPRDSPDAFPHQSTLDGSTTPRLAKKANNVAGVPSPPDWPNSSITSEIGERSQAPIGTFPVVHSTSPFSERFQQADISMAQLDATPAATLSHPLENNKQHPVTPWAESLEDSSETCSNTPTHTPLPTSDARILNKSPTTNDANPASISISKSLFPAPYINFSTPDIPLPSHAPPLTNAEPLSILRGTSSKGPSDDAPLPNLGARTLVSDGNRFLSVLQLLVYCPPFLNLFMSMDMNQREAGETGGVQTPLVDATVRLLDEFANKDKSPVTQQFLQKAARGQVKENDKKEDCGADLFTPTTVYDAMKDKRPFINDSQQHDAAEFLCAFLEDLDEELVVLQTSMSTLKSASTSKIEELEEETRQGISLSKVGERNHTVRSRASISRIFGGRFRSIVHGPNQPDTTTVEDWRLLQLDIWSGSVHTIEDALAHILRPQPGQIGQSSSSEARQHVQIETLPPVLVLHLRRFVYDDAADGIIRISKHVHFTPELDVSHEIMAPVSGKSAEPAHYKLYGVLYHHGESTGSGYYSVDVVHSSWDGGGGEVWLRIDDEAASTVQHEDVFGDHSNEKVDDRCAYILLYCRTAPSQI